MRKLFFFLADGERRKRLGNLPGMQIDGRRLRGGSRTGLCFSSLQKGQMRHRIPRGPGKDQAHYQQTEKNKQ
jgi:hypothetical protein